MRKARLGANLIAVLAVTISIVFVGRQTASATSPRAGTVNFASWSSNPTESAALSKTLKAFTNKTHITVNFQVLNGNYPALLKTRMTAGNAPDVFYMNSDVARDFILLHTLHSLNYLKKVKSFGFNKFYKSIQEGFVYKGTTYGFAKDYSTLVLWYNKSMFKSAHISKPPTTWAQFTKDACKLTNKSKGIIGASLPADIARWLPFVYEAGGAWLNKNQNKAVINSKAALSALNFYANVYKKGCATFPSDVGAGWNGEAFGREKVAMAMEGNWMTSYMQQTFPNVKWGIADLPRGPHNHLSNLNFTAAYAMWAHTPHFKQATTLMEFLAGKQGEAVWAHNVFYLPSRSDVSAPALPQGSKAYISQVKYSHGWFFPPGFADSALTPVNNDLMKVMKGQMSPKSALSDMQSKSQHALNQAP